VLLTVILFANVPPGLTFNNSVSSQLEVAGLYLSTVPVEVPVGSEAEVEKTN